jgi:mannonate dehydratase
MKLGTQLQPRDDDEPGRGGASCAVLRRDRMDQASPPGQGRAGRRGERGADRQFLTAVIPAADAAGVRLACHPHDT